MVLINRFILSFNLGISHENIHNECIQQNDNNKVIISLVFLFNDLVNVFKTSNDRVFGQLNVKQYIS